VDKKDYMKKVLIAVMAFSLGFAGCRKEANQVVSRPLNEVQGSVVATPTPTPSPSPISEDEEFVRGAGGGRTPFWLRVVEGSALICGIALVIYGGYRVYRWWHRPVEARIDYTEFMIRADLLAD
jgi:hypothetical protein